MSERRVVCVLAGLVLGVGMLVALRGRVLADATEPHLDVPYEPSPPSVVQAMLKLAKVGPDDVVYDLGCGDGRIVIAAVKDSGAKKGVGIDIDPERIKECKDNATLKGVADKVVWQNSNFFEANLKEASVVTAYLLPNINLMVRPMLYRDLKPGSRVVTHAFHMADWEQDFVDHPKHARSNIIYLYIIPASVGGTWEWTAKDPCTLNLEQEFQFFRGHLTVGKGEAARITDQSLKGTAITFTAPMKVDGKDVKAIYRGVVDGNTIKGTADVGGAKQDWTATRKPFDVAGTWTITVLPADKKLDGVLTIEKLTGSTASGTYTLNAEKGKAITPQGIYVWGPSVRFEVPAGQLGGPTIDFKGILNEGTGKGTVTCEGWSSELNWTAAKK